MLGLWIKCGYNFVAGKWPPGPRRPEADWGRNAKRGNMSKTVPVADTDEAVGSRSPSPASGQPETEGSNEMFLNLERKCEIQVLGLVF